MDVFGKGADFDPSQDSMVRVYAHNLRQKLEHYYATEGRAEPRQLTLARGEYRVSLAPSAATRRGGGCAGFARDTAAPVPSAVTTPIATSHTPSAGAARRSDAAREVASSRGLLGRRLLPRSRLGDRRARRIHAVERAARAAVPRRSVAASPIWAGMLDDDMPILVVVGDYYIFGELDEHGDIKRLVRDFTVELQQGARRAR